LVNRSGYREFIRTLAAMSVNPAAGELVITGRHTAADAPRRAFYGNSSVDDRIA
jgi:hypothetical protein